MQVYKNNIAQFMKSTDMCFVIPVYQRNYDWTEDNCKQLWDDLWYVACNQDKTHFLGTICTKSINSREKTIIDGQQRITTMTLLVKALHDSVDNAEFKKDIDTRYLRNTGYGTAENYRVKLHLNRRDDLVYNKLLQDERPATSCNLTDAEMESNVFRNYSFFRRRLEGLDKAKTDAIYDALSRFIIVDLDVEMENPQEIFESLNSTGLDLTDVDLLRNFLLMSLDYESQMRLYDSYWFKIEENVGPRNMVRFFVDYLIYTKKSDSLQVRGRRQHINDNNLYTAFKLHHAAISDALDSHSDFQDATERLLVDMHEKSQTYRHLVFTPGIDMNDLSPIDRRVYSIVALNEAERARPVLMYIMERHLQRKDPEAATVEMLDACLSLVFRAKATQSVGINGQFAGNVLQRLDQADEDDIVDSFWRAITAGAGRYTFPPDNVFRNALLNRPIFDVLRGKGTKYLLYTLEQHTIAAKGLPRYDNQNISIEHIMPKTLSSAWKKALGDDVPLHADYLNKLGNLALTSNNPEMSNKSFLDKTEWYGNSSFFLTRKLAEKAAWSISDIRQRSEELADRCIEIWSIPMQYQPIVEIAASAKRRAPFRFSMIGLEPGDEIAFTGDASKTAIVHDDSHVIYNGDVYSLSALAQKLLGFKHAVQGPLHFSYDGEILNDIRESIESNMV